MAILKRLGTVAAIAGLAAIGVAATPHEAKAWWRGGWGVGVWIPPVVVAPPPVYYAPPAAGYVPQPGSAQAPVAANPVGTQPVDQSYCRQYQGTVVVDGATQPSSGVACKQPNGSWRIVQ